MTKAKKRAKRKSIKKAVKKRHKKEKRRAKKTLKKKKARAELVEEGRKRVDWASMPGEEPTEEEYLDEDYPAEEGFGIEEEKVRPPEDDYSKLPTEIENIEEEEEELS
jgi:hypothetical protein